MMLRIPSTQSATIAIGKESERMPKVYAVVYTVVYELTFT